MKKVKVVVSYEFELPIAETEAFKQYPEDAVKQIVFDGLTNYVVCAHLRDATKWCNKDETIFNHHNFWADLLGNKGEIKVLIESEGDTNEKES
jgi:hypothetical protein